MSLYSEYVKEREGKTVIENKDGFIKYSINKTERYCYLEDLFILPESRKNGIGQKMAEFVQILAKNEGCKKIITSVVPSAKGCDYSMKVVLKNGYRLRSAHENIIFFEKDI